MGMDVPYKGEGRRKCPLGCVNGEREEEELIVDFGLLYRVETIEIIRIELKK